MKFWPAKWRWKNHTKPEVTVTMHGTMSVVSTSCPMARNHREGDSKGRKRTRGYGGFLKWWYPTTMGFPILKMIILGCFGGTTIYGNTPIPSKDDGFDLYIKSIFQIIIYKFYNHKNLLHYEFLLFKSYLKLKQ